MRKMKLQIEALQVDSFDTTSIERKNPGTVQAHADADREELVIITTPQTRDPSCFGTCMASCFGTCEVSCGGSCQISCDGRCTQLCSYGCSDGCTAYSCLSGAEVCCA